MEAEAEAEADIQEPESVVPTYSEEEFNRAREESYEAGKEDGIKEAAESLEQQIHSTLKAIGIQTSELFRHQKLANAEILEETIDIAVAIARKCFPTLNDEQGLDQIEQMVRQVLSEIIEEPRVIIHVNPAVKEALSERIDQVAAESHFEGRIVIVDKEDMESGDCRIEWSNGGAERSLDELWRLVDETVESNLGALKSETQVMRSELGIEPQDAEVTKSGEDAAQEAGVSEVEDEPVETETAEEKPAETVVEAPAEEAAEAPIESESEAVSEPEAEVAAEVVAESEHEPGQSASEDAEAVDEERGPPPIPSDLGTEAEDSAPETPENGEPEDERGAPPIPSETGETDDEPDETGHSEPDDAGEAEGSAGEDVETDVAEVILDDGDENAG